ncbi:AraC family transcriptional regulator [bacterium]|nr:AraC family transcriptional regulator [bacterium]
MIFIFGIAISVFLFVLLLFKKNRIAADNVLLFWLLIIVVSQFLFYFDSVQLYENHLSFLIGINLITPFLHPPLLFLYVSALTGSLPQKKVFNILHFVPVVFFGIYLFVKFFSLPAEQKLYVMTNAGIGFEDLDRLRYIAIVVIGIIYVLGSLYRINIYQKKIRNAFSNIEKINLKWLQVITYGIGIIWITVILGTDIETNTAVAMFVLLIGFFGVRQTPVFTGVLLDKLSVQDQPDPIDPDNRELSKKYETSGLSQEKKLFLETALARKIDEEKLYLDPELSLDKLASLLNVHPNYLSQYINEVLQITFYDYINFKRIEEFKRSVQLQENKNLNLLGLSYDCGFNSKSSFNRNFKKFSGQTPSEYLSHLNKIPA